MKIEIVFSEKKTKNVIYLLFVEFVLIVSSNVKQTGYT